MASDGIQEIEVTDDSIRILMTSHVPALYGHHGSSWCHRPSMMQAHRMLGMVATDVARMPAPAQPGMLTPLPWRAE
jgi:hypothetical protein